MPFAVGANLVRVAHGFPRTSGWLMECIRAVVKPQCWAVSVHYAGRRQRRLLSRKDFDRQRAVPPGRFGWTAAMGGGVSYVHCRRWIHAVVVAASVLAASGSAVDAQYVGTQLEFNIPSQPLET